MFEMGRDRCGDPQLAGEREWLVTNGIGGFAMGTLSGELRRRYHGLLVAALQPPVGRRLLLAKLDESVEYDQQRSPLSINRWAGGAAETAGLHQLEQFRLEGTTPVWRFAIADARLEKRVWMEYGANTTYIRYDLRRATRPLSLSLKALVNYRDYHATTQAGDWQMRIEPVDQGLMIRAFDGATAFYLLSASAAATIEHAWYRRFFLMTEAERGLDAVEDHLYAGRFEVTLQPGESVTIVASTEPRPDLDGLAAQARHQAREQQLLDRLPLPLDAPLRHLALAADQCIVRRPLADEPDGLTVIAGYPWFADWGRDTMIALSGLTLATGRPEVAARILRTFARFVDQGMLPNRFPDAGEAPEYNTVDATLWYLEAIRAYHVATGDDALLEDLFPVLAEIIAWHQRGTRYSIQVDPTDGLLFSGQAGVQLTWMDVKIGDWVVTPRTGKAVEVNALWFNALRSMAEFARRLRKPSAEYTALGDRAAASFDRFWNAAAGCLYDVIDGPEGIDASPRPNQLLAVSLTHSPLSAERQRAVVDFCARRLVTSYGLRSLAVGAPAYAGRYGGPPHQRDAVYHQGTVWAWLSGPFVSAHRRVYGDPALARSFLEPLLDHLAAGCIGSIAEIFDGDPPHTPRGCVAQAWSVAELLRAWSECSLIDSDMARVVEVARPGRPRGSTVAMPELNSGP